MKRYDNLIQGSDEWHDLRAKYTKTASRTPIILGLSPFSNTEKLAQEIKFGIKPYYSKAMQQGNNLEDYAREMTNGYFDDVFIPTVGVRKDYLASLDGINFAEDTIIELKVSEKTYSDVKNGLVPDYYYSQIQHQMMVFNKVEKAYLVAYSPSNDDIAVSEPIEREKPEFYDYLERKWQEFEEFLKEYEMPQANNLEDSEAINLAMELFEINEQKKALEVKEKAIKEQLTSFVSADKTTIGNLTISKQKGAKKIDYVKLINDKNVDVSDIDNYTTFNKDSLVFRFGK